MPLPHTLPDASSRCPPDVCVAAVLGDALRRVSVLGGREGMSRSLGSVYGASVTRFLGGSLRGVVSRVISTPGVKAWSNGIAVSRDGCTLLASDCWGNSHAIHEFDVGDGSLRRVVGSEGASPLQFSGPCQVSIAPDGFVFVAEFSNNRVQVLMSTLDFHSFVGVGQLELPSGVCANDDIIVVSENGAHRVSVFSRRDGHLLHRIAGARGRHDGQLDTPHGLCFTSHDRHVAVADEGNNRVCVFGVDAEFIRHVGAGTLDGPQGVASSAFDELVVADSRDRRVVVFSDVGELLMSFGDCLCVGVAVRGGTVFAADCDDQCCVVFQ